MNFTSPSGITLNLVENEEGHFLVRADTPQKFAIFVQTYNFGLEVIEANRWTFRGFFYSYRTHEFGIKFSPQPPPLPSLDRYRDQDGRLSGTIH